MQLSAGYIYTFIIFGATSCPTVINDRNRFCPALENNSTAVAFSYLIIS